jgi:hypothetical protein
MEAPEIQSPRGTYIAKRSEGLPHSIELLRASDGKLIATLDISHSSGHDLEIVEFSEDEEILATSNIWTGCRTWRCRDGRRLADLELHGWLNSVKFQSDQRTLEVEIVFDRGAASGPCTAAYDAVTGRLIHCGCDECRPGRFRW